MNKEELLIREISRIEAGQTVTLHIVRLIAEALAQKDTIQPQLQELMTHFEHLYEDWLRTEMGYEPLHNTSPNNPPSWPELFENEP